ncbi:MAG TPA: hypothetical protein VED87_07420 [Methylocystis sp.]|nr:hypothetical protein [Methylocystis sp.]
MKKLLSAVVLGASIASILGAPLSSQAMAQTEGNVLRGLSQFQLSIETFGEYANCGLTKDLVRDAVLSAASGAPFQVTAESNKGNGPRADATLYVKINTLAFDSNFCVTHIMVDAYEKQSVILNSSRRQISADVDLWDEGSGMGASSAAEHPAYVAQMIGKYVRKFINEWNLDNRGEK